MSVLVQETFSKRAESMRSEVGQNDAWLETDLTEQALVTNLGTYSAWRGGSWGFPPPRPGTCSGRAESSYYMSLMTQPVLAKAEHLVRSLPLGGLRRNAEDFLSVLREVFLKYEQAGVDVSTFPALGAFLPDDRSVQFEWASSDSRLGFGIETDPDKSCWYLITTADAGAVKASGLIHFSDLEQWLLWLVFLVVLRS
ncbi:MAG: hypothetical protein FJY85_03600 [Deltaproteobacteria bacterium]|nr:hypothetical protein [Deltaproteobacteria bacterium]